MTALQDINLIGSICSILGLLISIGVLIYSYIIHSKLTTFRGKILKNENLPDVIKDLKKHHEELHDYYMKFDQSIDQIRLKLEEIKVATEKASHYLGKNERKHCVKLNKAIVRLNEKYSFQDEKRKQSFKEGVWDIYTQTVTLVRFTEYYLKDLKKFDNYA